MSACGGGQRQDASEPSGKFPVSVDRATFPSTQRLAQHTHLVITVRNSGNKAIPDVAVTICNVTCAYPAPKGEGSSAGRSPPISTSRTWPIRRVRCGSSIAVPGPAATAARTADRARR